MREVSEQGELLGLRAGGLVVDGFFMGDEDGFQLRFLFSFANSSTEKVVLYCWDFFSLGRGRSESFSIGILNEGSDRLLL